VSDTVTVLRTRSRRLGKRIRADGTIEAYDKARSFDLIEIAVASLDDIQELLRRLERYGNRGIVRGATPLVRVVSTACFIPTAPTNRRCVKSQGAGSPSTSTRCPGLNGSPSTT